MRSRGISRHWVVVIVAVSVVAVLGFMAIQPVIGMPDEANRVKHPDGFSIIVPPEWDHTFGFPVGERGLTSISAIPHKPEGRGGEFSAVKLTQPPTESELRDNHFDAEMFDGQKVWVARTTKRDGKEHFIVYDIPRGSVWYKISIRRPISEALEGKPWDDYVRSLRVETPVIKPAAQ